MVCGTYYRYVAGDATVGCMILGVSTSNLLPYESKLMTDLPDWFGQSAYLVILVNHTLNI